MSIHSLVDRLCRRLFDAPQYPGQGAVLFVDLGRGDTRRKYLPAEVLRRFLGGRGANMWLLYNLLQEEKEALDPQVPLIFGTGVLTATVPSATRGNFTGKSPESYAILDTNAGDYFPSFLKRHGYDHLVLYGRAPRLTMLRISADAVEFLDASRYAGMDNIDFTAAVERDLGCTERRDMAMARITAAGENGVLCSGIMGGPKAIWARGGGGAKMGSLGLKAIIVQGKPRERAQSPEIRAINKAIGKKITGTSVIKNALKMVGTPFLYKPCRTLGALSAKNNQETTWTAGLDADKFDPYRPGMDGCFKCPVQCRMLNDMTAGGKGGWGADALKDVKGNVSYGTADANGEHQRGRTYKGIRGDGKFDRYDKGDGPDFTTLGKLGPVIGISEPEQVMRLNNILNDLGLDSASTGSALAWAMELFQRGIITTRDTGGLDLSWGNYQVIEKLFFMTARREGFGDTIADSARAVERGKYPAQALKYFIGVKGLSPSETHDSRILKAFALGHAVATRGMDHLRNRATLEINARINDDPEFKRSLYGGVVSGPPTSYEGKEYAVRKCENTFAAGDAVGMCRFDTKLFNSPSLPDLGDFARQVTALTGISMGESDVDEVGRNITGLERLLNFRLGLRAKDDTLPDRWFAEGVTAGPFKGEHIDRAEFEEMKSRFYEVTGLNREGAPAVDWHEQLARATTGFAIRVELPRNTAGAPENEMVIDEPLETIVELREALKKRIPRMSDFLADRTVNVAVNGNLVLSGEQSVKLRSGDRVALVPVIAGG